VKTGLVLEGGGVRGIYTAGILDVFLDHGIKFDGVLGVSAGAIHGCSYLSNQKGRSLRYYKNYCNDWRFTSIRSWILTGDIVGAEFCYHTLPDELDLYDYEAFTNCGVPFYVGCSNLETGESEYPLITDMHTQVDYMRASASLPYFSRIVKLDGKKYLDGGCTDSIPVEAFQKMGYERNVVILTREADYRKKPELSFMPRLIYGRYPAFAEALLNRHNTYNDTVQRINEMEANGSVFVFRPEKSLNIGRLENDPEKVQHAYDAGCMDAEKQLHSLIEWMQKG